MFISNSIWIFIRPNRCPKRIIMILRKNIFIRSLHHMFQFYFCYWTKIFHVYASNNNLSRFWKIPKLIFPNTKALICQHKQTCQTSEIEDFGLRPWWLPSFDAPLLCRTVDLVFFSNKDYILYHLILNHPKGKPTIWNQRRMHILISQIFSHF